MMIKVKVGHQLGVPGGPIFTAGYSFDAPDQLAQAWITAGQATVVPVTAKAEKARLVIKAMSTTHSK